jgi:hypothetical protein
MAYRLVLHETNVVPYLSNLDLSRAARITLAVLLQQTRDLADTYRNDPERRLAPGSDCFQVDLVFRDPVSQTIHHLRLIISDAPAQYGVLRVVYAEDETGPAGE